MQAPQAPAGESAKINAPHFGHARGASTVFEFRRSIVFIE